MYPTNYFRWAVTNRSSKLEQWWVKDVRDLSAFKTPENCYYGGEWRAVEKVVSP